jgi:hypothetical protein
LDLAPNIVLPSCHTVPLSEACESVWCISWPMWHRRSAVKNATHLHKCQIYWYAVWLQLLQW